MQMVARLQLCSQQLYGNQIVDSSQIVARQQLDSSQKVARQQLDNRYIVAIQQLDSSQIVARQQLDSSQIVARQQLYSSQIVAGQLQDFWSNTNFLPYLTYLGHFYCFIPYIFLGDQSPTFMPYVKKLAPSQQHTSNHIQKF